MTIGIVFRRAATIPSEPTKSRKRLKYYVGRLSRAMEAKLDKDRKVNRRCSTLLIFGHVQYGQDKTQTKKELWEVTRPDDKRSWNDATADEIELAILLMIIPMPDTYVWQECRLYAQKFISESSLLPLVISNAITNGAADDSSTDEEDDPYLPKSQPPNQPEDSRSRHHAQDSRGHPLGLDVALFMQPPEPRVGAIEQVTVEQFTNYQQDASDASSNHTAQYQLDSEGDDTNINDRDELNKLILDDPRGALDHIIDKNGLNRIDSKTTSGTTVSSVGPNQKERNNAIDLVSEDSNDDIIYEGTYQSDIQASFFRRKATEFQHLMNSEMSKSSIKNMVLNSDSSNRVDRLKPKPKKLLSGQTTLELFFSKNNRKPHV